MVARGDLAKSIYGPRESVSRVLTDVAWSHTRRRFNVGSDEAPFSPYDEGVTLEMRAEMVKQADRLIGVAQAVRDQCEHELIMDTERSGEVEVVYPCQSERLLPSVIDGDPVVCEKDAGHTGSHFANVSGGGPTTWDDAGAVKLASR